VKIGVWLKGLAAAVIGGAITSAAQAVAGGNLQSGQIKGAVIAGALLTVGAYLTRSPIGNSGDGSETKK
jgi:hypothetical protein